MERQSHSESPSGGCFHDSRKSSALRTLRRPLSRADRNPHERIRTWAASARLSRALRMTPHSRIPTPLRQLPPHLPPRALWQLNHQRRLHPLPLLLPLGRSSQPILSDFPPSRRFWAPRPLRRCAGAFQASSPRGCRPWTFFLRVCIFPPLPYLLSPVSCLHFF